jgi:D-methionine transport system substrate-binding protein
VNPNPDAGELADIAISSAETARMFGIEPLVAMLSYSTGVSGGVIKLAPGSTFSATELDIVDNPKKVKILAMETAQLPRSLDDVDFSVITSFFALSAGLVPNRDSLLIESQQSDYVCLIGVARKNADKSWVKTLVESYQSPEVKEFVQKKFNGNIISAW